MLAVLERAVDDFRTYANVPTGRGRWLFMEVAAWFDSSETGPFDFEGICEATGLDPDFIRKGLRSGYDTQRPRLHDVSGSGRSKQTAGIGFASFAMKRESNSPSCADTSVRRSGS